MNSMENSVEDIIKEVLKRRNRVHNEKMKRGQEMNQNGYYSVMMSAYDFYRGAEYELTKLLDWLGYEE